MERNYLIFCTNSLKGRFGGSSDLLVATKNEAEASSILFLFPGPEEEIGAVELMYLQAVLKVAMNVWK